MIGSLFHSHIAKNDNVYPYVSARKQYVVGQYINFSLYVSYKRKISVCGFAYCGGGLNKITAIAAE
jgi:hypothetical protein